MQLDAPSSSHKIVIGWNTLAQFVGKVVSAGGMFIASLLVARSFGVNVYGDFTKITTYVAFYYLLADFGLNAIYLQVHTKTQEENLWPNLLGLRLVGSLFLIFMALAILSVLPQGTTQGYTTLVRWGIIVFLPAILFQSLITTTNAIFQKHLRYDLATVALTAGTLVSLFLIGFSTKIIAPGLGAVLAGLALLIGAVTTALVGFFLIKRLDEPVKLLFNLKSMRKLFLASIPLGLMLLFNQVYFRFDSFVLTLTRSTAEVGVYGLAYKVFEIPLALPTFFMNATYPLLLNSNRNELGKLVSKSFWFLLLSSVVTTIIIWIGAPLLVFIRPEFSASTTALRILVLGLPFFFITSLLMWILVALEKQKILPFVYGVSMFLIIILDAFFIPRYGYPAAAWITVAAEGAVLVMLGSALLGFTKNVKQITNI